MKQLLFTTLFVLAGFVAWGQSVTVSGVVTADDNGQELPGVSVVIQGSSRGTVTDANGRYSVDAPAGATLVFSFIGYQSQQIKLTNQSKVDVKLGAAAGQLDEVVVVGFGTQTRRDLTGSVSSVDTKQLTQIPVANFQAGLQGLAPGLNVTNSGGSAGSPVRIRIRGSGSLTSGSDPLFIVDGVPIESESGSNFNNTARGTQPVSPLNSIDPNEIQSIEVLKDAAAGAIYGSRAANGVIIITTKRGRAGKTKFNAGFQTGTSSPTNRLDYLNGTEYIQLRDQAIQQSLNSGITFNNLPGNVPTAYLNGGYDQFFLNSVPAVPFDRARAERVAAQNINHFDDIFVRGSTQLANLSAAGGSEKTQFYVGGSIYNENSFIANNYFKRLNGRINLDHQATAQLKFGVQLSGSYSDNNVFPVGQSRTGATNAYEQGGFDAASNTLLPIFPRLNDDGTYFSPDRNLSILALRDEELFFNKTELSRYLANVYGEYKLLPSLSLRTELGSDFSAQVTRFYVNPLLTSGGLLGTIKGLNDYRTRNVSNINNNTYLTYNRVFAQKHALTAVAGVQYTYNNARTSYIQANNIPSITLLNTTQTALNATSQNRLDEYVYLSYLARINYKFAEKYLLAVSFRADGSSRFGADNRYGYFPSVSAGWVLTEESFLKNNSTLTFLKLRASYGQTGNSQQGSIVPFSYPALGLGTEGAYGDYFGFPLRRAPNVANSVRWERSTLFDLAVDFGLLRDRFNGTIGYYNRQSTDLLLAAVAAPQTGIIGGNNTQNAGALENKGVEFNLAGKILNGSAFKWQVDINAAYNTSNLLELNGLSPSAVSSGAVQSFIGKPIGTYFLPLYLGVDPATGYETFASVTTDASTGYPVHDASKPIVVDFLGRVAGTTTNVNFATIAAPVEGKPAQPKWTGGLTNTFSYKGLSLGVLFTFSQGAWILDQGAKEQAYMVQAAQNVRSQFAENVWQKPGDVAENPAFYFNPLYRAQNSSRFLYNADFVRVKNVRLSYALPGALTNRLKMTNVSVFANLTNVLTFTKFPGWDPEVIGSQSQQTFNNQASNQSPSTVNSDPPQAKTFLVGLNFGF
ncbi:SusC/RagA family TonB-linked outer membrane protein [Spirosoma arcticum]